MALRVRSRAVLALGLLASLLLSHCRPMPPHHEGTIVITVVPPPPKTGVAPSPAAPELGTRKEPFRTPPSFLLRRWRDRETNTVFAFSTDGDGQLHVTAVDDDDNETLDVLSIRFDGESVTWAYRVPSSGTSVTFTTERISENELQCHWTNDAGASGPETLVPVR